MNAVTSKKTNSKVVEFEDPNEDAAESTSPATASAKETAAAAPAATTNAAAQKPAFDRNDQTTWDCQHDGCVMPLLFGARLCKPADLCADAVRTRPCSKWLARHEKDYIVTLGHVECISVLKAYKESQGSSSSDDSSDSSSSSSDAPDPKPNVDKNDQTTWVCQHDGYASFSPPGCPRISADSARLLTRSVTPCSKWLARHEQDYIVTLGHVECIDDLKAYKASLNRKMAKRSREQLHAAVARRTLQERASPTYFTMCAAMLVILDARAAY